MAGLAALEIASRYPPIKTNEEKLEDPSDTMSQAPNLDLDNITGRSQWSKESSSSKYVQHMPQEKYADGLSSSTTWHKCSMSLSRSLLRCRFYYCTSEYFPGRGPPS